MVFLSPVPAGLEMRDRPPPVCGKRTENDTTDRSGYGPFVSGSVAECAVVTSMGEDLPPCQRTASHDGTILSFSFSYSF